MALWIKKNSSIVATVLITIGIVLYCYGCEAQTPSLRDRNRLINRQELQLELDQIIGLAQIRMLDLDKQEAFRAIILENALILVQGNPYNPVGLITGVAAIYGLIQGSNKVTKAVKKVGKKRTVNNV